MQGADIYILPKGLTQEANGAFRVDVAGSFQRFPSNQHAAALSCVTALHVAELQAQVCHILYFPAWISPSNCVQVCTSHKIWQMALSPPDAGQRNCCMQKLITT